MNFTKVLQVLLAGKLVRRPSWAAGAWLMRLEEFGNPLKPWWAHARAFQYLGLTTNYTTTAAHLDLFDGEVFHVGWTPANADLVADDWEIVPGEGSTNRPTHWRHDDEGNTVPAETGVRSHT